MSIYYIYIYICVIVKLIFFTTATITDKNRHEQVSQLTPTLQEYTKSGECQALYDKYKRASKIFLIKHEKPKRAMFT